MSHYELNKRILTLETLLKNLHQGLQEVDLHPSILRYLCDKIEEVVDIEEDISDR